MYTRHTHLYELYDNNTAYYTTILLHIILYNCITEYETMIMMYDGSECKWTEPEISFRFVE